MATCNRNQYQDTPVVLPGIRRVLSDDKTVSVPTIANIVVASVGVEYSYTLPVGNLRFCVKNRDNVKLQFSYVEGTSDTVYRTIPIGCSYAEDNLDPEASITLYVQAKAVSTIEIISWA